MQATKFGKIVAELKRFLMLKEMGTTVVPERCERTDDFGTARVIKDLISI
jgi:hypothetical protein